MLFINEKAFDIQAIFILTFDIFNSNFIYFTILDIVNLIPIIIILLTYL